MEQIGQVQLFFGWDSFVPLNETKRYISNGILKGKNIIKWNEKIPARKISGPDQSALHILTGIHRKENDHSTDFREELVHVEETVDRN